MKQGWEIKKLGEICNKITNIKWNEIDKTTSFPYIDLSAVDRENSSIHDYEYINISNAPSRAKQIVKVGDILFATTRPMLKRACIIPNEFNNAIASTGFCVLRPQGTVLSEWIYHNIKSNRFYKYIEPIQKGVSYPAVTDNEVKDFCIPVPPRAEQERIVAELDCLSGVIEKKREQLRELDALAQSIFYQMFGDPIINEKGWEVKKLEEVCHQIGDGLHGTPKYDEDGGVAFINGNNLIDGKIVITDRTLFVNDIEAQKYRIDMDANTILLSINGTLGRTAIFRNENVILGKSACYCNINNTFLITKFVEHLMNSLSFKGFLEDNSSKSTIRNVGLKAIRGYGIILPPLILQQEFADKIEAIEKQKELIKQSITQTEELFNARMDYYFN